MVDSLLALLAQIGNFIWGPWTLLFLGGTAGYLTIRSKVFQVRKFGTIMKNTLGRVFDKKTKDAKGVSPFQAMTMALASTVGTGNIAGVATALSVGGPGAIFWMWLLAFLGMMSKTAEVALAVHYREIDDMDRITGGPQYYMRKGLGWNKLAKVFSGAIIINALMTAALLQPHTVGRAFLSTYGINPYITATILAVAAGFVIIGGVKRIAEVTEFLVPFMAIGYTIAGLFIVVVNFNMIPEVFVLIFKYAFAPAPALGGFAGAMVATTISKGISRGMMSNEAGQGTAPMAHAKAETRHPIEQGMWGAFEVFVDTIIVCSITAFAVLSTGALSSGQSGVDLVLTAFDSVFPGSVASLVLSIAILTFCFSSTIGFYVYYETSILALFGRKPLMFFKVLFLIPGIVFAGISNTDGLWSFADIASGITAIPNLVAVLALSGVFFKLLKDYESGEDKYTTAKIDISSDYIRKTGNK